MTAVALIAAMVLLAYLVRLLHYRQSFGRWAWGRLRSDERQRLLPHDSRLAYERGYRDGIKATRAEDAER